MAEGKWAEEIACRYLRAEGFKIVARNWRWRGGEVDIVAKDGETLVFVEVKGRRGREFGSPEEAVDPRKRGHLWRTALAFLGEHVEKVPVRFDVIAVSPTGIRHIRAAFAREDVRQGR